MTEPTLSVLEAAKLCRVSVAAVVRWILSGKLPAQKLPGPRGKEWRVLRGDAVRMRR